MDLNKNCSEYTQGKVHRRRLHQGNRGICPGNHEGTGEKITFCPGNFQRVCNGLNLVTAGHYYIRLDCAQTRLLGLSITPSVHRSVRLESIAAAFTSTLGGVFNRIFTFYHVLKGNVKLKPCSPSSLVGVTHSIGTHSIWLSTSCCAQHDVETSIGLRKMLKLRYVTKAAHNERQHWFNRF